MREKHYVERNGKLYARAYYKDPKTGKWKQVWRKVDSKTQAREVAHQVTQQLKAGPEAFENKDTLNAYLDSRGESKSGEREARAFKHRFDAGLLQSRPAYYAGGRDPETGWYSEVVLSHSS